MIVCLHFSLRVKHGPVSHLWLMLHVIVKPWNQGFLIPKLFFIVTIVFVFEDLSNVNSLK